MKKLLIALMVLSVLVISAGFVIAGPGNSKANKCTTIQSGELEASNGEVMTTGFDEWGYNYQAHMFNGYYENYNRPETLVNEGDRLQMKWNDAWLSNKDCDGDGLLDRHAGLDNYIGSGAWLTNHMSGVEDGEEWTYFVKIVAKPSADYECEEIWGQFCIIQEVSSGEGSTLYGEIPGLGYYRP